MKNIKAITILGLLALTAATAWAQVQSPQDFLGFKVGTDRKLADMNQIITYFQQLDKASGRVLVQDVGKTTEGNPFIVAYITSEKNHADLEKYRDIQQALADPRTISDQQAEEMISQGRAIVMINCSIHASEVGASQMSMQLAYDLATKNDPQTRRILENVILLLTPMHNPDGTQMVVDWYKKHLGTKYEGGRMPWMYHKYVGHDNNRDWFMFTQKETQLTIKVHNEWHPQVIVDMHQMGSTGARLFVPPFVDPYEPNIDPILRQQVAMMGTFIASELTAQGKAGVVHSQRFDAWTPARAYHHYHGGIRILTEAASARIATPIDIPFERLQSSVKEESVKMPLPWKGGSWTLGDIVAYDYAAAWAALTNAAGLRENWVRNYYRIFKNAVNRSEAPYAYVVPSQQRDLGTAIKMLNVLKMGGVEVHQAQQAFSADGHEYAAGSFIVYLTQPFGGFAKTMLEIQVYPEIREAPGGPLKTPYDVVGHTLPLLMGVEAVKIEKPFSVKAQQLDKIVKPAGRIFSQNETSGYVWGYSSNDDMVVLNRLTKQGFQVFWTAEELVLNGKTYAAGAMLIKEQAGLDAALHKIVQDMHVTFQGLTEMPNIKQYSLVHPRVGLYKSWSASMDEGWTRFVLEQFEFDYQSITNRDIRKGGLEQAYDVIILPDMGNRTILNGVSENAVPPEYAGGIGEIGVKNLKDFIQKGGTLITLNGAAEFALKNLHLGVENKAAGLKREDFFIPGSLLKVVNDVSHPLAFGYPRDAAIFFRRSPIFAVGEGHSVVSYPAHALQSGWVTGEEHLTNKSAVVDIPLDQGKVILIGFPALYRSQSHGSFRYLFNAIYYGASK
ncbi:MAG: hypothetical protein GQ544_08205 [Candidatus Aminicenantes bacterium]|nr:hypothetical protein [Candidatus Aminicenantes bacterium]